MLKTLWKYIQEHPGIYLRATIVATLSGLLALVPNYFIQRIIDDLLKQELTHSVLGQYIWTFAVIVILLYIMDMLWVRWVFHQANDFKEGIKNQAFSKVLTFRKPFFHQFRSGDILTRLTSDIDAVGDAMSYGVLLIVSDAIWMLMILVYLFVMISWKLTIISMLPMVAFGVGVFYVGRMVDQRYTAAREAVAQLNQEVLEVIEGVRVMRAYGQAHLEQERFKTKTEQVMATANHQFKANALYSPMIRICSSAAVILSIGMGSRLVQEGIVTVGELVAFQIYLGMFLYTVWGISDIFALYQTGQVSFKKVQEMLTTDNPVVQAVPKRHIESIESLTFKDYDFGYDSLDHPQLIGINFSLHRGQTLGVVGKTGSGKTSLIMQLLRQYPVSPKGQILVNGFPITDYPIEEIEALIAYVPQEHVLFSRNVRENIFFGKEEATDKEYQQAIRAASFQDDIGRMSQGEETLIGEKGVSISGGQKQRISLARAFIRQANLLILDDSLSAVDARTERKIIQQIQALRKGRTNIIITHRLSAIMHADYVLVLEDGAIIEEGNPQTLLQQKGWFQDQYHHQRMEG